MGLLSSLTSPPLVSNINNNMNVGYHQTSSTSNIRPLLKTRQGRVRALTEVVTTVVDQPDQAQVTWEIVVGSLAGVTPFVVAGIEFNKRIVAQRKCEVCGGSGLVLRDKKYYFRCPRCGGFLPWQSWKRFFSG